MSLRGELECSLCTVDLMDITDSNRTLIILIALLSVVGSASQSSHQSRDFHDADHHEKLSVVYREVVILLDHGRAYARRNAVDSHAASCTPLAVQEMSFQPCGFLPWRLGSRNRDSVFTAGRAAGAGIAGGWRGSQLSGAWRKDGRMSLIPGL